MSTAVLPVFVGRPAWPVKRSPIWKARITEAESGKESAFTYWSYPRWQYELTYDALRQGTRRLGTFAEFAQMAAFFNARSGPVDSFLYQDMDDNAVTGQALGPGDGTTTSFQLVRAFGGYVEPVFAPNVVSNVYLNGAPQSPASYTVNFWGATSPGTVVFNTAPGAGVAISADFSFYWPCRFGAISSSGTVTTEQLDFEAFMSTLYSAKSVKFISLK